jgi:thiol-disulfide isomerase/thioredoxin
MAARAGTVLANPLQKLVPADPPRPVKGLSIALDDGSNEDLATYRGKLIVLNMWGSWCFPCRDEMPSLSRLAEAVNGSNIIVLPLAIERHGAAAVHQFFQETAISNLPLRLGDGDNIAQVFKAWGLPYTVLIDAQGNEFARVTGPARWDDPEFVQWLKSRT